MKKVIKILWIMVFISFFISLSFFAKVNAQSDTSGSNSSQSSTSNWWWRNSTLWVFTSNEEWSSEKECKDWCCGIKLNTNFPIIWNCIETKAWAKTDPTNVFPYMIWAITKIVLSLILVVCFILIIVSWIMRAWAWEDSSQKTKAKDLLKKIAVTILLLWFSWIILRLINPNFFG